MCVCVCVCVCACGEKVQVEERSVFSSEEVILTNYHSCPVCALCVCMRACVCVCVCVCV